MKHPGSWPWCLALAAVVVAPGCRDSNPQNRQAVSGMVTLDGKPLEQGMIVFQPQEQQGTSGGAAVSKGKYSIPRLQGLAEGKYRVEIRASEKGAGMSDAPTPGMPKPPGKELIPAEYNSKSDKTVTVTAKGPNEFKFDIMTKK
jgi:hypothetical protein